jgi:hypothetical protein
MNIPLLKKYECNKLENIVGSKKAICVIETWLDNYYRSKKFLLAHDLLKKSSKGRKKKLVGITENELLLSKQKGNLLITGAHGTGKTLIMNLLLKEQGYKIYYFSKFDNKSKVNIKLLEKLVEKNNKIALIIDDLESIITLNDKKSTSSIITDNNFKRTLPVIILTNNQHNKQLNDIKKYSDEIKIYSPYPNEITAWLTKICIKESIRFDYGIMAEFLVHCQNDLRKILIQLDNLKLFFKNRVIKRSDFDDFKETMKNKNMDIILYKGTEDIMKNFESIEHCMDLYEGERVLIPLMMQENYYKFIEKEKYSLIMDIISTGDIIDNYIHSEQNWNLSNVRGIISTVIPSYLINKYKIKYNANTKLTFANSGNTGDNDELVFATDLNRTSVKKMNSKNTKKINEEINKNLKTRNKTIDEFIFMGDIINKNPDLGIDFSDDILKINKIKLNNVKK